MNRLSLVIALTVGAAVAGVAHQDDLAVSGPEEPDERFSVYVLSELEDTPEAKYESKKIRSEVEKKVKDQKKWFIVSKGPEKAEIELTIVRHTVEERMRHKLVPRVDVSGTNKNWVTETWAQENHYLEARVSAFGTQSLLRVEDTRENGGSLKRVSEKLAESLESHCRERYEELSRLRRLPS